MARISVRSVSVIYGPLCQHRLGFANTLFASTEDHTGVQLRDTLSVTLEQWAMKTHCHNYRQCQQHQTSTSATEVEEIKLFWS